MKRSFSRAMASRLSCYLPDRVFLKSKSKMTADCCVISPMYCGRKPFACLTFLQVNCTGSETRLENCDHPPWGNHSCGHFEDAGVRCVGPDTTRECVDECGEGYFKVRGKMECGVCMASCFTCANSASNCTSCDKPRFLKGIVCEL